MEEVGMIVFWWRTLYRLKKRFPMYITRDKNYHGTYETWLMPPPPDVFLPHQSN